MKTIEERAESGKDKQKEEIISILIWAKNLYSQAGDESNTRRQYRKKYYEARKEVNKAIRLIEEL
jgi:hypothetical protein